MKKKLFGVLFIGTMFLMVLPALAKPIAIDNMKAGDTIKYKVNEFQFPLDIFDVDTSGSLIDLGSDWKSHEDTSMNTTTTTTMTATTSTTTTTTMTATTSTTTWVPETTITPPIIVPIGSPFDLEGIDFDLAGSTIAVKVMQTYPSNYYLLSAYFILGKSITLPISNDPAYEEARSILGNEIVLPSGMGLGLSTNIVGSDILDDSYGLPYYLDPNAFEEIEDRFETMNEYYNATVATDFTLEVMATEGDMAISGKVVWFGEGEAAGYVKSASLEYTSGSDTFKIGIEYQSKENIPLAQEVKNKETLHLMVEKADATYTTTGDLDTAIVKTSLDAVKNVLTDLVDIEIAKFAFTDHEGCYYEADIYSYDMENNALVKMGYYPTWFNGFVGAVTYKNDWGIEYDYYGGGYALYPMAPAITPDFTMWGGSVKTIDTLIQILVSAAFTENAKNSLDEMGITINGLSAKMENRRSGDITYFYLSGNANIDYINPINTDQTVGGTINYDAWIAYTSTGLLAGTGIHASIDVALTDFPNFITNVGELSGTLGMNVDIKIKNKDLVNLPAGSEAAVVDLVSGGVGFTSPGFPIVELLLILTTITLVFRRRKSKP
ncbi:MAG: hypothetical protein ACXAEU_04295 [Candidatus Hodarchaeales archaeon]